MAPPRVFRSPRQRTPRLAWQLGGGLGPGAGLSGDPGPRGPGGAPKAIPSPPRRYLSRRARVLGPSAGWLSPPRPRRSAEVLGREGGVCAGGRGVWGRDLCSLCSQSPAVPVCPGCRTRAADVPEPQRERGPEPRPGAQRREPLTPAGCARPNSGSVCADPRLGAGGGGAPPASSAALSVGRLTLVPRPARSCCSGPVSACERWVCAAAGPRGRGCTGASRPPAPPPAPPTVTRV